MKYTLLNDIEEVGVSHNPDLKKKVLIANGEVPHLTQFSRVTFKVGQIASSHKHEDMYEIFSVESGIGKVVIDGKTIELAPGVCVTVEPGEEHEITNTGSEDLLITILGIEA